MPSILIIDDDATLLAPMVTQLEEAGFEVARSTDVRHGERLFNEHRPDLMILEVRSEGDRGWDLLMRLASMAPVIVLSAAAREEDVVRAFAYGAVDHISKPYRSAELLVRIKARLVAPLALSGATPLPSASAPLSSPLAPASASIPPPLPPASARAPLAPPSPASVAASATAPPSSPPTSPPPSSSASAPTSPPPSSSASASASVSTPLSSSLTSARAPLSSPPSAPASAPLSSPPSLSPSALAPESVAADVLAAHRATQRRNPRGTSTDESVFMSEAEEMALLRTPVPPPAGQTVSPSLPDGDGGLGWRMRVERLRRHLTLVQVENELKIRISYLQAMEDEKLTLLPRGSAAPQMVKDYADFLGLDAATALDELRTQHHSEAVTPIPALGGSRVASGVPRWVIILAAVLLALVVGAGGILLLDPGFFARLPALIPPG